MPPTPATPRVVHIATGGNALGGAAQHIYSLAPRLQARGLRVTLVFLGEGSTPEQARQHGLDVETVPKRRRADPRTLLHLARLLKRLAPQIVHTHNLTTNFYGRTAARAARVPHAVTTVHSFMGDLLQYDRSGALGNRFLFWHTRFANRSADRLVAVSERVMDWLLSTGVPQTKVRLIRCGLDLRGAAGSSGERHLARARLGLVDDDWVIGNVARMDPVKDQAMLVAACLPLLRKDQAVKLVIVGDGPERSRLESRARDAGVQGQVLLPGLIPNAHRLMPAFDVFALSSRMEGIPLAMLEALAASVPVVATEVGGIPEVIDDGLSGLLVPPGEPDALTRALTSLAGDKLLGPRLGAAGRRIVEEQYDVEVTADLMAAMYREVLGGTSRAGSRSGADAGAES